MTELNMAQELNNAELELVAGGVRGGETTNSYGCSETVSTPRGNIVEVGYTASFIGETYSNKAE